MKSTQFQKETIYLECGLRFYKITHLRDHLHVSQGFSFAVEEKNYFSERGLLSIQGILFELMSFKLSVSPCKNQPGVVHDNSDVVER